MIKRNSDRDTWKLAHWDEYIAGQDFSLPEGIKNLFVFDNSSEDKLWDSIHKAEEYLNNLK